MPKLTDKEIRKFQKLAKLKDDSDLVLFDEIEEIRSEMEKEVTRFKEMVADIKKDLPSIYEMLRVIQGNKGDTGAKGDKGEKGDKGDEGPQGEPGKDGKDGRDGKNGKDADEEKIMSNLEGKIPGLGGPIRDALELLHGEDRLEISAINGLEERIKTAEEKKGTSFGGLQNTVRYYDVSSQLNGVLKEFYIPTHRVAVQLIGTQFPIVYRPGTDFTTAKNTLTLTSAVSAPETGQSLILLYVK